MARLLRVCVLHLNYRLLSSDILAVLEEMLKHSGNKPFMLHEAQFFPPYCTVNAYDSVEQFFKRTVRIVPLPAIPPPANVILCHTI